MKFILGLKLGMSQIFDEKGNQIPVTLIEAGPCLVTQIKTKEKDGYSAVQIGFGEAKKITKAIAGHLKDLGKLLFLREFRNEEPKIDDKEIKRGDKINVSIFQEGNKVRVSGLSKGKGFAGVVKRWHFRGRPATHGTKHELRTPGSVGTSFPERVIKGKKMPGRMGYERVTIRNLKVVKVDPENNLLAIKGAVPGRKGTLLEVRSMKYVIYNQRGKEIGHTLLPKEIFALKINPDLVHQVVVSQMASRRKIIAHTKTRAEVRGGGRKPWRQKGTGRARAGSIRSPLWRGGGVTFGPTKAKVFKKKISKKMKRKALFMVLAAKAKNNLLILLDKLKIDQPRTKLVAEILAKLPSKRESSLLALPEMDKNIILAARNLLQIQTIQAKDLNCLDLLAFKYLIMPKEAIRVIKETFLKS